MPFEKIQPPGWAKPIGYANGMLVTGGRLLFIAGQVAFDAQGKVEGVGDLAAQFRRTLSNIREVCETAGGRIDQVVKMTVFVKDKDDYRRRAAELGAIWKDIVGRHFPAMTLVEVSNFYEPDVLIEIESVAVID